METFTILALIFFLLLCLIATVIVLIAYSGVLESVEVGAGRPPVGKVVIAYKFARGPYSNVGPTFFEAASIAPDNKAIGIYYDDPRKIEASRLRYAVASVLAEDEQKVDEDLKKKFEENDFKIMELPRLDNVVRTSFPYKSALSIFVAVQKVYPKLSSFIEEYKLCAHPYLEIYEGSTIHFMVPLSRQDEFYVPEALQHFPGEEPYESIYSVESTQDISQSDLSMSAVDDSQTEPSLLDSPDAVRAAYFEKEGSDKAVKEASSEKGSEQGGSVPSGETTADKAQEGSDEDSTSSFEDLKAEASEELNVDTH